MLLQETLGFGWERPTLLPGQETELPSEAFLLATWDIADEMFVGHKPSEETLKMARCSKHEVSTFSGD